MKENTNTLIRWLFFAVLSLCLFLYLKFTLQPELIYHVQQTPFIMNRDFFSAFPVYAGGISKYMANFLMQFFFYRWAGPFILMAAGLFILLADSGIARTMGEPYQPGFLMIIPFLLSMALVSNYYFPFVVIVRLLLVFLAVWLFGFLIRKGINAYLVGFPIALILYYLAGSGPLMVFSLTTIVLLPLYKISPGKCLFFAFFSLLFIFLMNFACANIMPGSSAGIASYFSFLPDMDLFTDAFMNYKPGVLFYLFCYSLPLLVLILGLKNKIEPEIIKRKPVFYARLDQSKVFLYILLTTCLAFFLIRGNYNRHQKNIILTDFYCYSGKWKNAIDVALSDPEYDVFINYYYNRAIDNYGKFPDMFFNYPQYRIFALYPDRMGKGNPGLSLIISDYYFDLGYISISQQWAYGAMALMPYNPRVLKRLVLTNIIYGNYRAAHELLNVLSDNPISGSFVDQYLPYVTDTNRVAGDPLIMEKRTSMPSDAVISDDITERLETLLAHNHRNQKAYEHLQMCYLLVQNLDYFVHNLPASAEFYSQMPSVFEQALLTHVFVSENKNVPEFKVSKASRETFADFFAVLKPYKDNKDLARQKLSRFANTFMYYAFFYNPPDPVSKADNKFDYQ
jgi:Family of unknown function (DUF6057)